MYPSAIKVTSETHSRKADKCGGLEISGATRMWSLEYKNAKLQKLLAYALLDNAVLG